MSATLAAPAIGSLWEGQGGIYAGVCRGRDGKPDYHLVLALERAPKRMAWKASIAWAKKIKADGHKDFSAPERFESALLYANVQDALDTSAWHWTATQYSAGSAWSQYFLTGYQYNGAKSYEAQVRAVRRLPINSSVLSIDGATA